MKRPAGYRAFHVVSLLFVATLLISNTIAVKLIVLGSIVLPAGILCFPIAYILNDVIVEVYGYERTRGVIWWGFGTLALMSGFYFVTARLPFPSTWPNQEAFEVIFLSSIRISIASFLAYLVGAFLNSFVLSKMKQTSGENQLWLRLVGSTIIGEGADSFLFNMIAFGGIYSNSILWGIILWSFLFKVFFEILATPITYLVIGRIKTLEEISVSEERVDYNPFKIR